MLFFLSFLLAFLITPMVIKLYKKHGWLDDPKKQVHAKKTHKIAVPRGGGIVVFFAILVCSLLFLQFDQYLLAILAGAGILAIVGFLDDIYDLHPFPRLLANGFAALLVVGSGIGIAYVSNPFGPGVIHLDQPQISFAFFGEIRNIWLLADLFAVLFIIWNINIVNWSKGVDGQLPGFAAAALVFIGLLSSKFVGDPTSFNTAQLAFIVAGAFTGLLLWNWYPQRIMPGYGAGSLAGFFLGVLAILSGAKLATTLMVLAIPTADAIFTIGRRLYAGKSPFWGDRGHLHHKLFDTFGWSRQKIAIFYSFSSIALGTLSLYLNTIGKLLTIAITMSLVFGVLFWVKIKKSTQKK
ncbi:MAG: undecaprenyl/decaprenyl-phosphate alpha-N-acetylglucosaminyl 1-phosphate transferase [Candidatus Pacebacteria bacterium]|nr:undecaprenyl/decaprenyl-phosphate alpha-N-acetylglucosaminyl 1-phosphate transferase [Candidatus Paceibacterota bacterium]